MLLSKKYGLLAIVIKMAKMEVLAAGFLLSVVPAMHAETAAMTQTKTKLKQLDLKISHLQHILTTAHDKTALLSRELADTEKKISMGVHELRKIQQNLGDKQQKINELEKQVTVLSEQLHTQQALLAKHVRARYLMGEYQPLKWLLNQDDPAATSRLLTFYQYVVKSRQHIIVGVQETQHSLTLNQEKLKQEALEQKQLQDDANKHQQKLEQDKLYSTAIIQTLNKDIQSQQQALKEYRQNKENLSYLLKTLIQQSIAQTHRPFTTARTKLPKPINVSGNSLQKINQGLVFYAHEGTPVAAVYSGKVVFSDWLKGYGLLLIIDHGQGFMTLYAHNQSLFKQKGDPVVQGEQIATVGHSGGLKQNGLYFEIRRRGKAIPPLAWLS